MPDIEETVESINSIQTKYKALRQASKAPSFALSYLGTHATLMSNCGFSEEEAKRIEANYHELYKQSEEWTANKIKVAQQQGYIDVAFGLRIRTPLLHASVYGSRYNLKEVESEIRSVANALSGQSYGQLTNRALNEFLELVYKSPYRHKIKPVATIHDAIYLLVKDEVDVLDFVNRNLIKCMQWQELDEIKHDSVHLEAELDVFYPDWSNSITLPNSLPRDEIKAFCRGKLNE